jgi:hypothetical protein
LLLAVADLEEFWITAVQMVEIVLSLDLLQQSVVAVVRVISIVAILKLVALVVVVRALQPVLNALAQMEQQGKVIEEEM